MDGSRDLTRLIVDGDPRAGAHAVAESPALAYMVEVGPEDFRRHDTFIVVDATLDALTVRQLGRRVVLPRSSDRVRCVSQDGWWTTRILDRAGGRVMLEQPEWIRRPTRRRCPRVPVVRAVQVQVESGPAMAGQLQDLSLAGAGLLTEAAVADEIGETLTCALPIGVAAGRVASRRAHAHPLLVVLGIEWTHLDGNARLWITQHVVHGTVHQISAAADDPPPRALVTPPGLSTITDGTTWIAPGGDGAP